jgi:hypothetical protein
VTAHAHTFENKEGLSFLFSLLKKKRRKRNFKKAKEEEEKRADE